MGAATGLDLSALRAWLDRERPGLLAGPLTATPLTGGRSNLTFLVETPQTRVVLRRPPLGEQPATAHDMSREFRIITALAGSEVPVPHGLLLCEDTDAIGARFYLMQYVEGQVFRAAADLAAYDERALADLARRLVGTLVAIHSLDLVATGLTDLGRPDGYLQRQLDRWSRHLEVWGAASDHRDALRDLGHQLADRHPATTRTALVHGDFRLDNLIVGSDLEIRAVLDWEMATIGDPLADLGLFLTYWDLAGEAGNALSTAMGPAAGFPPGTQLAEWYAEQSGLDLVDVDWYLAFGAYKLAVVLEGVRQREAAHPVPGQASVAPLIPLLAGQAQQRLSCPR